MAQWPCLTQISVATHYYLLGSAEEVFAGLEERREEAKRLVAEASAGVGGSGEGRVSSDVEELREVLQAISAFLRDLSEPVEKLLSTMLAAMDGKRLGEEVSSFYARLREGGVPEDMAAELTRQYFQARIEAASVLTALARLVKKEAERGG